MAGRLVEGLKYSGEKFRLYSLENWEHINIWAPPIHLEMDSFKS